MASIYGVEIKNLKEFKDHEGIPAYQGTIYIDGKKQGFWSQSFDGAIVDTYEFNEKELTKRAEAYMEEKGENHVLCTEIFLSDLVSLMEDEKPYKKALKNGFNSYIQADDGFHYWGYMSVDANEKDIVSSPYHKDFMEKCQKECFKNAELTLKIYTDKSQFVIKNPADVKKMSARKEER